MESAILERLLESGIGMIILIGVLAAQRKDNQRRATDHSDLIISVMENNKIREEKCAEREAQSAKREDNYQSTIRELIEKFEIIEDVKETIEVVKIDIDKLKERM